ncbi:MAG: 50S ribosomal protein L16 [Candidatus Tagabacteria bacterium RIFCSPLOWO2_01_FULL_39_11]|uniref:Large ribosomal subunit protein uL16 n=1 Tax=Candidatus Tagabacteria bacterium RIFCSPLOWO2_01_FULL_39_11 TaxID=1802295 RepID=A0A1G2LPM4_9BACT|nr:MAG: 50S ribosomal protein L16 [Candidatus Tagabacteria bacterium RIFCSPLOWO2_01_FULL_39_11]
MLFPKKVKFRKWQRQRKANPGAETRGTELCFGSFGLKAEDPHWITSQQIESARKAMARFVQKGGKIWIRIFPDKPITKKPPEVKMGKGKGDPVGFVAPVRRGRIIFEIDGIPEDVAREALKRAAAKLPIGTRIVSR